MASADKTAAVAEIVDDFRTANATVLTEYRGLSATPREPLSVMRSNLKACASSGETFGAAVF